MLDRLIFYLTTKSIPTPRLKVALHLFFLRKKTGFFSPPSWKVKGLLKIYPSDKKARRQKLQPGIAGVCSTGTSTVPQKLLSDTGIFSIQPAIQLTKQDKQIRRVSASHSQHSSRMQKKKKRIGSYIRAKYGVAWPATGHQLLVACSAPWWCVPALHSAPGAAGPCPGHVAISPQVSLRNGC